MDFESKEDKVTANPTEACACEPYESEQGVRTTIQPQQEDGHWDAECDDFFVVSAPVQCSVCLLQIRGCAMRHNSLLPGTTDE